MDCLRKLMVNLLQKCRIALKVVIVTFTTNNGQINRKSSKMNNCKLYWKNPAQTLKELAQQLEVDKTTISRHLQAMRKIQEKGRWLPHELIENAIANRLNISISLLVRHKKKSFLWRIVTGDEKWNYFDNPKRKKSWVGSG